MEAEKISKLLDEVDDEVVTTSKRLDAFGKKTTEEIQKTLTGIQRKIVGIRRELAKYGEDVNFPRDFKSNVLIISA